MGTSSTPTVGTAGIRINANDLKDPQLYRLNHRLDLMDQQTQTVATAADAAAAAAAASTAAASTAAATAAPLGVDNISHAAVGSSNVSTTTVYQDVPGATITLERMGTWLVAGVFYLNVSSAAGTVSGALNAAGAVQVPLAIVSTLNGLALTACQTWLYNATSAPAVIKLQVKSSAGAATCYGASTTLTAVWLHG